MQTLSRLSTTGQRLFWLSIDLVLLFVCAFMVSAQCGNNTEVSIAIATVIDVTWAWGYLSGCNDVFAGHRNSHGH